MSDREEARRRANLADIAAYNMERDAARAEGKRTAEGRLADPAGTRRELLAAHLVRSETLKSLSQVETDPQKLSAIKQTMESNRADIASMKEAIANESKGSDY